MGRQLSVFVSVRGGDHNNTAASEPEYYNAHIRRFLHALGLLRVGRREDVETDALASEEAKKDTGSVSGG
jgi:hypothetical protein